MNRRIRIVPVWNPKPNVGLLAQVLVALARQAETAPDDCPTEEGGRRD
jgi:hypothetical protein